MEWVEVAGGALAVGLTSYLAARAAPAYWQRAERERRAQTLRRLSEVARSARAGPPPPSLAAGAWRAADFSRYFVPAGLRLDQARQVIREARETEKSGARC